MHLIDFVPGAIIRVNDKMQKTTYVISHRPGRGFDPLFEPELTPKQMLALGIFEGKYLRDCRKELPVEWFSPRVEAHLAKGKVAEPLLNYYKIKARLSLQEWRKNGWIGFKVEEDGKIYKDPDPRGWFQWYCRYYLGRRSPVDTVQISRWRSFRRHIGGLIALCKRNKHCKTCNDCYPKKRQAILQWAYDPRKI